MSPQAIVAVVMFCLGLLCGWGPTYGWFSWQDTKRVSAEQAADIKARDAADQQRQETSDAWAKNLDQILKDKGAYERCVAAGRCGAVVRVLPASCPPATPVPPPGRTDAAGAGPVPAAAEPAAPNSESHVAGLIEDCKKAVGMANALQADIEAQPGYRR